MGERELNPVKRHLQQKPATKTYTQFVRKEKPTYLRLAGRLVGLVAEVILIRCTTAHVLTYHPTTI